MNTGIAALIATALLAAPAAFAGAGFPGLPDAAQYGHCQATTHNNASANATAFQNASYEEGDCEAFKPGPPEDRGNASAEEHRQDDAAREDGQAFGQATADERRGDHADNATAENAGQDGNQTADEHRQDGQAREDGRSHGQDRAEEKRSERAGQDDDEAEA